MMLSNLMVHLIQLPQTFLRLLLYWLPNIFTSTQGSFPVLNPDFTTSLSLLSFNLG